MPPDVRKGSALPATRETNKGLRPDMGVAPILCLPLPEGQRPSAHRAAQPLASAVPRYGILSRLPKIHQLINPSTRRGHQHLDLFRIKVRRAKSVLELLIAQLR